MIQPLLSTMMVISEEKSIIADTISQWKKVLTFQALSIFAFACPDMRWVSGYSETEVRFIMKWGARMRYTSFFWELRRLWIPGIISGSGIIDDIDDEWIEMISFNSLSSSWNLWIYSPWERSMGIPWFLKKVLHSSTHELIFLPQPYTRSARESSNARYQIHWR